VLRSLEVTNFRTFKQFAMADLGQINLCVGTNNCGKTSVLEAISILASRGRPESLWTALARRGEHWLEDSTRGPNRLELDICHLFHGHELGPASTFSIGASNDQVTQRLTASILEHDPDPESLDANDRLQSRQEVLFDLSESEGTLGGRLTLALQWDGPTPVIQQFPISRRGGLRADALDRPVRKRQDDAAPVRSIATEALTRDEIVALFEAIVLTPEEEVAIEALRTIEPTIERIAPIGSDRRRYYPQDRGGIVVKLRDSRQRIPIGSMGDGIWRMLGIALSLARAQGGILLVDEIDTGLHYSVMADMWRMVLQTAVRLDVQVFATTHSRDCYESLAAISRSDVVSNGRVSIQRIERGKSRAVAFSERDIVIAAERAIEVR
jgi:predicted ATPase